MWFSCHILCVKYNFMKQRNVKNLLFLFSRYNFNPRENVFLKVITVIAFFYVLLNSNIIRFSQSYDILASNEPLQRATEYFTSYASESPSDRLHESSRARELGRNATLLSLIALFERSQMTPRPGGARFLTVRTLSSPRRRERKNIRDEKKDPLVHILTRVNREQDISRCLILQKADRSFGPHLEWFLGAPPR